MAESIHKHPRGLRFRRGWVANKDAVEVTRWLIQSNHCMGENGFHSWQDASLSDQRGMWLIMNVRTLNVYVEARD